MNFIWDRQFSKWNFGNATHANRCDSGRPVGHFYESAREFLTATGFSYLRPAGRRRRGTILDTSAGAGTCNFSLPFSLFLSDGERATCVRFGRRERLREKERREGRFFWFSTSATSWSLLQSSLVTFAQWDAYASSRGHPNKRIIIIIIIYMNNVFFLFFYYIWYVYTYMCIYIFRKFMLI